jgi:hypothetical protein
MSTAALLNARGTTHGSFADNARNGQRLREYFRNQPAWEAMPEIQREALDMIATKLSRILSGQSTFDDHWKDIAGYATLVAEACAAPSRRYDLDDEHRALVIDLSGYVRA